MEIPLVLHIGLRKTGSSALQELLSRETGLLHGHGLDYPARLLGYPGHQELAWSLMSPTPAYVGQQLDRAAVFDRYTGLLSRNVEQGRTTLLSSEDLSLLSLHFDALDFLRTRLHPFRPKIVLFARDPVDYHVSNYKHAVFAGRETRDFRDYLFTVHGLIFSHAPLHRNLWAGVFGTDSVQQIAYDPARFERQSILSVFLQDVLGIEIEDRFRAYRSNVSISNEAVDGMLLLNRSAMPEQDIKRRKAELRQGGGPGDTSDFLRSRFSLEAERRPTQ